VALDETSLGPKQSLGAVTIGERSQTAARFQVHLEWEQFRLAEPNYRFLLAAYSLSFFI
jgi:hypothetical protein